MELYFDAFIAFGYVFILFVLPFFVSRDLARRRNRSVVKALFLTFFFGWLAPVGFWLALKTRRADGVLI